MKLYYKKLIAYVVCLWGMELWMHFAHTQVTMNQFMSIYVPALVLSFWLELIDPI